MIETYWKGCYKDSLKTIITEHAYAHPARMPRGLCERIFRHGEKRGYWRPGSWVLDCFGGVGVTALVGARLGYNVILVELEQYFYDLTVGCDCTGISKKDWVRFQGRHKQAAYKDRHWCPKCLAEAGLVRKPKKTADLFEEFNPASAYIRNSGRIPETRPHRFVGNLDLFQKEALTHPNYGQVIAIKGDSRDLHSLLAGVSGCVTSPPYARTNVTKNNPEGLEKNYEGYRASGGGCTLEQYIEIQRKHSQGYGDHPGQIATLGEGRFSDVIGAITSPPYCDQANYQIYNKSKGFHSYGPNESKDRVRKDYVAGSDPAQIGLLPEGAVFSPPYAESLASDDPDKRGGLFRDPKRRNDRTLTATYGKSPGQIGAMPEGAITSPPWENTISRDRVDRQARREAARDRDLSNVDVVSPIDTEGLRTQDYGASPGQIGRESGETYWDACAKVYTGLFNVLQPGGVSAIVVKSFVRDRKIVDLPEQTSELVSALGFEIVEKAYAHLKEDRHKGYDLFTGEEIVEKKARMSFFRRIHERKNPELAIDYEVVLFARKPL